MGLFKRSLRRGTYYSITEEGLRGLSQRYDYEVSGNSGICGIKNERDYEKDNSTRDAESEEVELTNTAHPFKSNSTISTNSTNHSPIICPHCNSMFTTKRDLEAHIKAIHRMRPSEGSPHPPSLREDRDTLVEAVIRLKGGEQTVAPEDLLQALDWDADRLRKAFKVAKMDNLLWMTPSGRIGLVTR
ncbi:C2H2-type zinc finger protein [Candidatus Bathyarchaeota archaeon]|nr:C2H2-type zinc finger protein [Candidatus Bathyarchaeota archaeon]